MSATGVARRTQSHQGTVRKLGRAGYLAYGVIHLLVGWLALQVAFGGSGKSADSSGALSQLAQLPLGKVMLVVITIGLALLAVWKITQVILGVDGEDGGKEILLRVGFAIQAVALGGLAVSAGKFAAGGGSSSSSKQQGITATLLGSTGGKVLIVLAGLAVLGAGIGMAVYGILRKFEKTLLLGQLSRRGQRVVKALGTVGYPAKGVAYSIVGVLLIAAAATADPKKSRGLDAALHTLAGQPYGKLLLVVVAVGIICFGAFCFARARCARR